MRPLLLICLLAVLATAFAGVGFDQLQLWTCSSTQDNSAAPYQVWHIADGHITLKATTLWNSYASWATVGDAGVGASMCTDIESNRAFKLQLDLPSTQIVDMDTGLCVTVRSNSNVFGAGLWLQPCLDYSIGATDINAQLFSYQSGHIYHVASGLCVDGGSKKFACGKGSPSATFQFCNMSLSIDARVSDLVSRLSIQDKAFMMDTSSGGSASVGLPSYQWWNEGLHGLANNVGVAFVAPTPAATSFPQPLTSAQAFNRTLWNAIGSAISTEARAFNNVGHAGLTYWAPNLNIFRDPRWGRGQETPGEDPYLSSEYAFQFVNGMQVGDDKRYLKTSACCKHFAAYSLESWNGTDRFHFNAVVSDDDMADVYFPAFQTCMSDAKGSAAMCSYNAVNGVPSCANPMLMTGVARQQWGFDGYITSDCGAVSGVMYAHNYTKTDTQTVGATIKSGMDIGCDSFLSRSGLIQRALDDKSISLADIDTAISRQLRVRFRLGEFDDRASQPYAHIGVDAVCSDEHMALAREAARQAIVLLFNPNNVLPINASTVQRVAVIGPVADSQVVNGGRNYAGVPCGGRAQTILDAFKQSSYLFDVQYVAGCSDVQCANATEFNHAKTAAANADLTIVVLGIDETVENEGLDRVDLMLPGLQGSLAAAVCGAARGPCVLALIGGGAVDIDDFINSTAAAFHLGLPGGNGASAFVDVVFGDTTPAGRLTQTFYSRSFVDEISMFEMGVRPGLSKFPPFSNPGRTYQWYTGNPSFVFGHGLSYTNWTLSVVPSSAPRRVSLRHVQQYLDASPEFGSAFAPIRSSSLLSFSINITNIGPRASEFVLLAMSIPPDGGTKGIPQQTLNGFDRVSLAVGSSAIVPVDVLARTFTAVKLDDDDASPFRARRVAVPGVYKFRFGVGDMAVETELLVENDL